MCVYKQQPSHPLHHAGIFSKKSDFLVIYNQSRQSLEHTASVHQDNGDLLLFKMLMYKVISPSQILYWKWSCWAQRHPKKNSKHSNPAGGIIEKSLLPCL